MSQPKTTRIPAPLYAAAGAGEMAFRQLLKLPAYANDLSDKAANNGAELRQQVITTTAELQKRATAAYRQANERAVKLRKEDLDMDRLRDLAMRQAGQFAVGAQEMQERAISFYTQLVARGEKVVGTGVVQAADTVQADMIETDKPAKPATSNGHIASSNGHGSLGTTETKPIAKKTVTPPKKNTTPNTK